VSLVISDPGSTTSGRSRSDAAIASPIPRRYSGAMRTTDCHVVIIPPEGQREPHQLQYLLDCITIRERVFVMEQRVPIAIEQDGKDNESGHVLLWTNGEPVGTLRFRKTDDGMKLERIAVMKEYRGHHLGKLLIREGIRAARMQDHDSVIYIHAQQHAASFYGALGFTETGEHTVEADIPHTTMTITGEMEGRLLDADPCALP